MSPLRPHFVTRVAAGSTCWRRVTLVLVAMLSFLHPSLWAEREYPEGPGEFIEQLFEGFAAAFFFLSETVEWIERDGFTVFEDAFGTGHPIGALTDDEVSHDIESAPAIRAFVCSHPPAGQAAEERIQR